MYYQKEKNEFGWIFYKYKFQNIYAQICRRESRKTYKPSKLWDFFLQVDDQWVCGTMNSKKDCEHRIDKILAGETPFDSLKKTWFDGQKVVSQIHKKCRVSPLVTKW